MIIDLESFLKTEQPYWRELEGMLDALEKQHAPRLDLKSARRFHYLYQRVSTDLGRISAFMAEEQTRRYLETLVARAYAEIHESRRKGVWLKPVSWFFVTFPRVFRKHIRAFNVSIAVTLAGVMLGALALLLDYDAKAYLMPFAHLRQSPGERVQKEETVERDRLQGQKAPFSSFLMVNNIKVSMACLALGMTWGVGVVAVLFANGVMLGAICADYIAAGYLKFLVGWLLPHGSIEIPAILIAGQAGLVMAGAMLGRGSRLSFAERLRAVSGDLMTLIGGVAVLLVYAAFVEAYISQYHEPVLSYGFKIALGVVELSLLGVFLGASGRSGE